MAYGSIYADIHQSSTAGTPPLFYDGNSVQIGTLCRAWVRFGGVTTVTINGSFNVSSVTRNGTGDYTVNFSTAMQDANYSAIALGEWTSGVTSASIPTTSTLNSASGARIKYINISGAGIDTPVACVSIFR